MNDAIDINTLSRDTGINVRTIRYYLAEGLLPPPSGRGPIGYDLEGRAVRIRGQESLSIGVGEQSLTMDEGNTQLEATRFGAKLGDARFSIQQAFFAAGRVDSAVKAVRHTADVVESRVGRIVERMRDAFREVEGVQQIRGGRIRMVARDAYTVMANHVTLKAEDDMEIMAEKIELG